MYYSPYTPQSASPYYNPISNPSGAIPVTIQRSENPYTPAAYGQQVYENLTTQSRMVAETMMEARRQRNLEEQQERYYELQKRQQELAERQAALQEELTRKQIRELEKQSELNRRLEQQNADMERQISGLPTSAEGSKRTDIATIKPIQHSSSYYNNEVPESLNYYKTEIQTIISTAKREIDQLIAKGDVLAAKKYQISTGIQHIFQDEAVRSKAMEFIKSELDNFKRVALKPFEQ
jgi:multidrug efflux pump subunit AcrA (membrane-fusion protein)